MSVGDRPHELVFQLWSGEDGVFLLHSDWRYLRSISEAISSASTWGEFERALPPKEFESLGLVVDPDYTFDPEMLPGFGDGDYPPWLNYALHETLPDEFVKEFADPAASMVSGSWVEFPRDRLEEMTEALDKKGFKVVLEADFE